MPLSGSWWASESWSTLSGSKYSKLVEAQQAVLPELGVVDRAFVEQQLAANHAVAGDGIALELDARDVELLAFVDVDVHRDRLLLLSLY